ncbi:MAG: hypothetical protein D9V46_01715 [Deltaproteobacteria bacterium]|nr:MAG: hypothetical protein D9V46_01715 [Deltaproteobacteria bacterium]
MAACRRWQKGRTCPAGKRCSLAS